jgi:hypothetical protein
VRKNSERLHHFRVQATDIFAPIKEIIHKKTLLHKKQYDNEKVIEHHSSYYATYPDNRM